MAPRRVRRAGDTPAEAAAEPTPEARTLRPFGLPASSAIITQIGAVVVAEPIPDTYITQLGAVVVARTKPRAGFQVIGVGL